MSPISRKLLAPASAHTAATASTNTSGNRRPRLNRGSGTLASTSSRPGARETADEDMRACETGIGGLLRSGNDLA
jgi:hypothetical protein